jgi:thiamine-monophosphate kinase
MSENRTELSDLGEFALIDGLTGAYKTKLDSTKIGIGDDAAVLNADGKMVVVTTDQLVEGVHFDLTYTPLKHLGYKAIVSNLSDIYAMNAQPAQVTLSIAVSNRFSLEALEELYAGIYKACEIYKVDVVGGDTTSSLSGLYISVTAIGYVDEDKVVRRNGASEGDLLVTTGDLGSAYMGLQILEREKSVFKDAPTVQPDLAGFDYLLERQLKPEARKDVIEALANAKVMPTSMIDISDGLASEIFHLCKQSDLSCSLYEDKIPIDHLTYQTARDFGLDPTVCALSGGEDYELLFTVKQTDFETVKAIPDLSIIGHMTHSSEGKNLITKSGPVVPLKAQGWDSFAPKDQ